MHQAPQLNSTVRTSLIRMLTCASACFLAIAFSGSTSAQNQSTATKSSRRPNILLIIADDLGYAELGCQGNDDIPTPNIDRLAKTGSRFTQAYVVSSYCSGSRAGLMSGRYPTRFGYEFNPIGADNDDPRAGLPLSENLISERLHAAGYVTGLVGKWHLGGTAHHHPLRRGFDRFYGFLHEGHYYLPAPWTNATSFLRRRKLPIQGESQWGDDQLIWSTHMGHDEPAYDANNPILREGQPVVEDDYLTDAITREAVSFIETHDNGPFFLCVAYNAVHSPMQAMKSDMEKFSRIESLQRRVFAGMLTRLDQGVGQLVKQLEQSNIRDETLIIFLSDNGGPTRELTSSNAPLRGEKGSLYEGGIRIPFIANWPGTIPAEVNSTAIWSLDLLPTFVELAGADLDDQTKLDGTSLMPLWFPQRETKALANREFYWRMNNKAAFRSGPWKMVGKRNNGRIDRWELYHLAHDLSERQDVSAVHPEIVRELNQQWMKWDEEMLDPAWTRERR